MFTVYVQHYLQEAESPYVLVSVNHRPSHESGDQNQIN